jgi:hypothetical protein
VLQSLRNLRRCDRSRSFHCDYTQELQDWLDEGKVFAIDQSFQGGQDFYAWLTAVGALSGTGINLTGVANSVSGVTASMTDRWIYDS